MASNTAEAMKPFKENILGNLTSADCKAEYAETDIVVGQGCILPKHISSHNLEFQTIELPAPPSVELELVESPSSTPAQPVLAPSRIAAGH